MQYELQRETATTHHRITELSKPANRDDLFYLLHIVSFNNKISAFTVEPDVSSCFPPLDSPENRAVVLVFDRVISVIVLDALGEAEISDLHRPLVLHQHISGGQVPVDVILRSQIVHSLKKTNKQGHCSMGSEQPVFI